MDFQKAFFDGRKTKLFFALLVLFSFAFLMGCTSSDTFIIQKNEHNLDLNIEGQPGQIPFLNQDGNLLEVSGLSYDKDTNVLSGVSNLVPYSGATDDVDLNDKDLTNVRDLQVNDDLEVGGDAIILDRLAVGRDSVNSNHTLSLGQDQDTSIFIGGGSASTQSFIFNSNNYGVFRPARQATIQFRTGGRMVFAGGTLGNNEFARFENTGNLGIGTGANPSARLHDNGNALIEDDLEVGGDTYINGQFAVGTSSPELQAHINVPLQIGSSTSAGQLRFHTTDGNERTIFMSYVGGSLIWRLMTLNKDTFAVRFGSDDVFRVKNNGNVEIDEDLSVGGDVYANDFITTSKVADFDKSNSIEKYFENVDAWVKSDGRIDYLKHPAGVEFVREEVVGSRKVWVDEEICEDVEVEKEIKKDNLDDLNGLDLINGFDSKEKEFEIVIETVCRIEQVLIDEPIYGEVTHHGLSMETRVAELEKMVWELKNALCDTNPKHDICR